MKALEACELRFFSRDRGKSPVALFFKKAAPTGRFLCRSQSFFLVSGRGDSFAAYGRNCLSGLAFMRKKKTDILKGRKREQKRRD